MSFNLLMGVKVSLPESSDNKLGVICDGDKHGHFDFFSLRGTVKRFCKEGQPDNITDACAIAV